MLFLFQVWTGLPVTKASALAALSHFILLADPQSWAWYTLILEMRKLRPLGASGVSGVSQLVRGGAEANPGGWSPAHCAAEILSLR